MSKVNSVFGVIGLAGFTGLIVSLLMVGCSAKVDIKSVDSAASSAQAASSAASGAADVEKPFIVPTEDRLAALLRTSDRLQQVCYGGSDENPHREFFYIKYTPRPDDTLGDGWIFIDDQTFMQGPNGKWWTAAPNVVKYTHIYPDVTGLQCKQQ